MTLSAPLRTDLQRCLDLAAKARLSGDTDAAWAALTRAHIVSQPELLPHLQVHWRMLGLALHAVDAREIAGQVARLLLAPIGHVLGRIPWGNSGRATMSMLAPASLPDDIARLYADAGIKVN